MNARLPSVDALLRAPAGAVLIARFGRAATLAALRGELATLRAAQRFGADEACVLDAAADALARRLGAGQRRVFNLTGTVLHTNLGRAPLPPEAAAAAAEALCQPTTLEYDLATGRRGERDDHVARCCARSPARRTRRWSTTTPPRVLLALNTLAEAREVLVSRGELIEIGGSFRLPDIIARAGARLVEVGTTNRTHARDFADAIGPQTAAIVRVHPRTSRSRLHRPVPAEDLAAIARAASLPADRGSGQRQPGRSAPLGPAA